MSRRRLLALAVFVAVAGAGLGVTLAAFSSRTSTPTNSFQAVASFGPIRLATGTYTGSAVDNRPITGVGFQPDLVIVKGNTTQVAVARTSTMSGDASKPLSGATALATDRVQTLDTDGFTLGTNAQVNSNAVVYHWTAMKADAGALKLSTYVGNGTTQSINTVGFAPEYVATLSAGASNGILRFNGMTRSFQFDANTGTTTGITSLDANGFSVGADAQANTNGTTYHYLAFNDAASQVKTSTYTGNNTDNRNITDAGFAPGFVLVRANDTGTSRRGAHRPASLTGDSTLNFNNVANTANLIQTLRTDGFQVGTDATVNANTVAYHYLAVKDGAGTCPALGSQTVLASADSYVRQDTATTNYGTAVDLFVRSQSGNANRRTLVTFNLPTVPTGCTMTGATLRLNASAATNGRTIDAYRAGGAWTEAGVTWNNQPATAGTATSTASGTGWRSWNVTTQVQTMYSGTNNGFIVRDQAEGDAASPSQTFQSRENTNDPELIVSWG